MSTQIFPDFNFQWLVGEFRLNLPKELGALVSLWSHSPTAVPFPSFHPYISLLMVIILAQTLPTRQRTQSELPHSFTTFQMSPFPPSIG